jgi:hypothetical protein
VEQGRDQESVLRSIFDRLAIGAVLIGSAVAYEALPVLICGILVGGSAIPLSVRAIGRRKRGDGDLEVMLDRRFAELDERLSQHQADVEYRTAQLVEVVEERIDFAEQLLQRHDEPRREAQMGLPVVTPVNVPRRRIREIET